MILSFQFLSVSIFINGELQFPVIYDVNIEIQNNQQTSSQMYNIPKYKIQSVKKDLQQQSIDVKIMGKKIEIKNTNIKGPESVDNQDIATKYRTELRSEVLKYMTDLPNSLLKLHSSAVMVLRIKNEILKFPQYLPCEHSNAIFVRVDTLKMASMNILISGPSGTPYAHGLYLFELVCDHTFAVSPPKMQLLTGKGKVRFNPNLYQNGYICLSLLGTWRGQNYCQQWNPIKSTLLQVFVSIQSLIMTEDVYFNEPGFQVQKGTSEGNLCNVGYCNIVKLANIRHAMIQMIRKPPMGFENVVRKHFFIKKNEILNDCQKWLSNASQPYKRSRFNLNLENLMENEGYKNLLEKEVNELRKVLMELTE